MLLDERLPACPPAVDVQPPLATLTPRQAEVLEYIIAHVEAFGYQPGLAELSSHLGLHKNGAVCHLAALKRKGFLRAAYKRGKALELIGVRFVRKVRRSP
jgi:SOS-response transcriptional repressor LexA